MPDGIGWEKFPLPLTGGTGGEVHKEMIWAGIHSRSWGSLINKSSKNHWTQRPFAPRAWVVVRGDCLVGEIEARSYQENPHGAKPSFELYDYMEDPAETKNLVNEKPELVGALRAEYLKRTESFKPPVN